MSGTNLITYPIDNNIGVNVIMEGDTIWATKESIAKIFDTNILDVASYIDEIYQSKEIDNETTYKEIIDTNTSEKIILYSIDIIIPVGFRSNSKIAIKFNIWAGSILTKYIKDGYVINEESLLKDPKKLNKLAVKLRELRASEQNVFSSVREVFKLASSDYEPSSLLVRSFYAKLQDKFHHAITSLTASKLVLDRAEHSDINMGLSHVKGSLPTLQEAKAGKNYLRADELYRMHLLSEQFLLFAESTALRGQEMTMQQLHDQLDKVLELNGYPVFDGYDSNFYLKDRAMQHAEREFNQFIEIKKLEYMGVVVDLESYYDGEYDNYKYEANKISIQKLNKALRLEAEALKIEEKNIHLLNKNT